MRSTQHFQRGGKGVFTCCTCGRSTRTVKQSEDSECCPQCWYLSGEENMVMDGYVNEVNWNEVRRMITEAVKKGGDQEKIAEQFTELLRYYGANATGPSVARE